jgi:beta-lactamase class A
VVAHKTGTSPTNAEGLSPATNDIGIITLPNGKHLAIAVFVCNSTDDEATRDAVIAKISKAAFDFFSK